MINPMALGVVVIPEERLPELIGLPDRVSVKSAVGVARDRSVRVTIQSPDPVENWTYPTAAGAPAPEIPLPCKPEAFCTGGYAFDVWTSGMTDFINWLNVKVNSSRQIHHPNGWIETRQSLKGFLTDYPSFEDAYEAWKESVAPWRSK